jgi:hypothetical protein
MLTSRHSDSSELRCGGREIAQPCAKPQMAERNMTLRRTILCVLLTASAAAVTSCLSPTLPLPPPDEPTSIQPTGEPGLWDVQGFCTAGAMVLIRNERTGIITGTEDRGHTGRYQMQLAAERCDLATVFEAFDDTITGGTSFLVRELSGGVAQTDCADSGP